MLEERLIDLRLEHNLTQDEVSKIAGVARSTYSTYENGVKPPLDVLINLSEHYNVSLDYLVGISNIREKLYQDPEVINFINQCLEIYYSQKEKIIQNYINSLQED